MSRYSVFQLTEEDILNKISEFVLKYNKPPTIVSFSQEFKISTSIIVKKFGSWNYLLSKANINLNKSSKRSDEELLAWLRIHPKAKYNDIPSGIRSALQKRFKTLNNARRRAGLKISDFRSSKNRKKHKAGRPKEYSKELIISLLKSLALKLGRPPRTKDINKKTCGFPISAIINRFGSFNNALQAAELPIVYTYQEFKKLQDELEDLVMNYKININDVPKYFNMETVFVYEDRIEDVKLTRSEIQSSIISLLSYKEKCKITIYYLVDDSLYEEDGVNMICIMDLDIQDNIIKEKIKKLRLKYDDINRIYFQQQRLDG